MLYNDDKQNSVASQKASERGYFITFEGVDGSGKTTQIGMLTESLQKAGITVINLREPGGTAIGEAIRCILLDRAHMAMHLETELLLFAAARAQLVREVIIPAKQAGTWVICDRYLDSTVAYQGYGRGLDLDTIFAVNALAAGQCRPDMTFLLDLPVTEAYHRLSSRELAADRIDGESQAFMQRTSDGYRKMAEAEPERIILMDAGQDQTELAQQIYSIIREGFGI